MIINYREFLLENNTTLKPEDFGITEYEWNHGRLDCYQDVFLSKHKLEKIPFNFGKIYGYFSCSRNNGLGSLKGCPETVEGDFFCSENSNLDSLEYCPKYVGGVFYCHTIRSLESIEDYPLCIINGSINTMNSDLNFSLLCNIVKENKDKFIPLLDNKIAFHQMAMRINPDIIKYYKTITPPSKKTLLFNI